MNRKMKIKINNKLNKFIIMKVIKINKNNHKTIKQTAL